MLHFLRRYSTASPALFLLAHGDHVSAVFCWPTHVSAVSSVSAAVIAYGVFKTKDCEGRSCATI